MCTLTVTRHRFCPKLHENGHYNFQKKSPNSEENSKLVTLPPCGCVKSRKCCVSEHSYPHTFISQDPVSLGPKVLTGEGETASFIIRLFSLVRIAPTGHEKTVRTHNVEVAAM